jgi:hypothetical protein
MSESLQSQIYEIMYNSPGGTIYTSIDFNDLGSNDAVRQALSRLSDEDKIKRLIDGYYTIPSFSKLIQEYSYPDVDQLANKIADKHAWTICPSGSHALNLLGLSTQVPNEYIYVSDGPYRTYYYNNRRIVFKHTSNRYVSELPKNISLLIHSIKALGKDNITDKDIRKMAKFFKDKVEVKTLDNVKKIPVWVFEVFKRIKKEMNHL